jgi:hypothetical protein
MECRTRAWSSSAQIPCPEDIDLLARERRGVWHGRLLRGRLAPGNRFSMLLSNARPLGSERLEKSK